MDEIGEYFALSVSLAASDTVVALIGEADVAVAAGLAQALAGVVAEAPSRVVLDLSRTSFMDGAAAQVIANAHRCLPAGCQLVVHDARPLVSFVLELAGLGDGSAPER